MAHLRRQKEEEEDALRASDHTRETSGNSNGKASSRAGSGPGGEERDKGVSQVNGQLGGTSASGEAAGQPGQDTAANNPPPGLGNLADIEWSYLDPQGQIQGEYSLVSLYNGSPHESGIQVLLRRNSCSAGITRVTSMLHCP